MGSDNIYNNNKANKQSRMVSAMIKENLEQIRKTYVDSIMMYLTTGKYQTPLNMAFITAYT